MSDPSNVGPPEPTGRPEHSSSDATPPPPPPVAPPAAPAWSADATTSWPVAPGAAAPGAAFPDAAPPPVAPAPPTPPPPPPAWGPPTEAAPPAWGPPTEAAPPAWGPPTEAAPPAWGAPTEAAPAAPPAWGAPAGPTWAPPAGPPTGPLTGPPTGGWAPGAAFPPLGGDPGAPPEAPSGGSGGRIVLIVAAVILVAALLGAGVLVLTRPTGTDTATGPSSSTTAAPTTASTTTAPPSTSAPRSTTTTTGATGTKLDPATVEAEVANLSAFVENTWGKPFKTPVKVEVVDDQEFVDRLVGQLDEEKDTITKVEGRYHALGQLPVGTSLYDVQRQLLSGGVLGYYDPETKELVVRGDHISPYVRQTIVHELTHAMQDQYANLDRKEYDDRKDEISFGLSALAEGDARRVEHVYENQLSAADKASRDQEETRVGNDIDLSQVPQVLLEETIAPYDLGEPLVKEIVRQGGLDALLAAFADPPTTSLQVLDAASYANRTARVEVPRPPADGEVKDEGVFGALETAFLVEGAVPTRTALQLARGWRGDWYVTYTKPDGSTCTRIDWVMDSAASGDRLDSALQQWRSSLPSGVTAKVDQTAPTDVRLTSCAKGA